MIEPDRIDNSVPEPAKSPTSTDATGKPSPLPKIAADEVIDVSKLSKEEQMALYEKELKENDWGHQPC
jgi:hypothetical protein